MRVLWILVLGMISSPAAAATVPTDVVDCVSATTRFQIALCSNRGAFDLMNHIHQRLVFAPRDNEADQILSEMRSWLSKVEESCMAEPDLRVTSNCLYDAASGPEAAKLLSRADALYVNESDIEGNEECDGCVPVASGSAKISENEAVDAESATTKNSTVSYDTLVETYTGYQIVLLCHENGVQFDQGDVQAMEAAALSAEVPFSQSQREDAWRAAAAQGADPGKMVFQLSNTQATEMCDGARLFVGGLIKQHRVTAPKPF